MPIDQHSLEEHIPCFSTRPMSSSSGMISISKPATLSTIQRSPGTSSAGFLDRLPLELLHLICASLDFQSLSRLSRTSLRGKVIVESVPAYRDLMKYAPRTLSALGETTVISVHSSALLHATLRSAPCVSCGEYGAFLFLPTCERICHACLLRNQSFWLIAENAAKKCFHLTQRQLNTLPAMYNIPGSYHLGEWKWKSCWRRRRLYAVKTVKKLAITIHGSERKVKKFVPSRPSWDAINKIVKEYHAFKWFLNAPLEPLQSDPLTIPKDQNQPNDEFAGMASIPFPSLSSQNSLETGLFCSGCSRLPYNYTKVDSDTLSRLVPPNVNLREFLQGMEHRARSKADFLNHIQNCPGIALTIADQGDFSKYY